jgi:flagellar motor component MotA
MNFELAVMIISTASMTAIAAAVAVVMMLRRKKVKKHSSALASLYELNEIHRNNFNLSLESEFENYKSFQTKDRLIMLVQV